MAHDSTGFRAGKAFFNPFAGKNQNPSISTNTIPPVGPGVFMSPQYTFYVPAPATASTTNLATTQTPVGAGAHVLTLTAGTGVTSQLFPPVTGVTVLAADFARNVQYSSNGNEAASTFTTVGYDMYGQPQTETVTGLNGNTVQGKKAFLYVTSITISAAAVGALTMGFGQLLGLPYAVTDAGQVSPKWANTLAQDAGTLVNADTTSPATALTGDVRGTYQPSSAPNASRNLIMEMFILNPDTSVGAYGVLPA